MRGVVCRLLDGLYCVFYPVEMSFRLQIFLLRAELPVAVITPATTTPDRRRSEGEVLQHFDARHADVSVTRARKD
jgi:hypothetical protein